jgi:hypothetical protein
MGSAVVNIRTNVYRVPESWLPLMDCLHEDPAKFDPESPLEMLEQGEEVCMGCPLAVACRELAIANHEHGLWGGIIVTARSTYTLPQWMRQRDRNLASASKDRDRVCKREACAKPFQVNGWRWGQQYCDQGCSRLARRERERARKLETLAAAS